jgi:hypothetical protein
MQKLSLSAIASSIEAIADSSRCFELSAPYFLDGGLSQGIDINSGKITRRFTL